MISAHNENLLELLQKIVCILKLPVGQQLLHNLQTRMPSRSKQKLPVITTSSRALGRWHEIQHEVWGSCGILFSKSQWYPYRETSPSWAWRHINGDQGNRKKAISLFRPWNAYAELLSGLCRSLKYSLEVFPCLLFYYPTYLLQDPRRGPDRWQLILHQSVHSLPSRTSSTVDLVSLWVLSFSLEQEGLFACSCLHGNDFALYGSLYYWFHTCRKWLTENWPSVSCVTMRLLQSW